MFLHSLHNNKLEHYLEKHLHCGTSFSNSFLGTDPLGYGLRCYMWTDKCTQEACSLSLSWVVIGVLFSASNAHRAEDRGSLPLLYEWSPKTYLSPFILGSQELIYPHLYICQCFPSISFYLIIFEPKKVLNWV